MRYIIPAQLGFVTLDVCFYQLLNPNRIKFAFFCFVMLGILSWLLFWVGCVLLFSLILPSLWFFCKCFLFTCCFVWNAQVCLDNYLLSRSEHLCWVFSSMKFQLSHLLVCSFPFWSLCLGADNYPLLLHLTCFCCPQIQPSRCQGDVDGCHYLSRQSFCSKSIGPRHETSQSAGGATPGLGYPKSPQVGPSTLPFPASPKGQWTFVAWICAIGRVNLKKFRPRAQY